MSRSGYTDDHEDIGQLNRYRANVYRALDGKRGQAFLHEMAAALDAMPSKELISSNIVQDSEHVCAMGAVALARKLDRSALPAVDDPEAVGQLFGIAKAMACEIAYENDERLGSRETPAERWQRMREWVRSNLRGGHRA
jgi:hypothetical protein